MQVSGGVLCGAAKETPTRCENLFLSFIGFWIKTNCGGEKFGSLSQAPQFETGCLNVFRQIG